jgi:AcrR family transcriptional regulator
MRADARLNQDRLLEAAARAFARDGAEASLKAIAKDAGVGIGTLYRRFANREQLVEATHRNETARLCAAAPGLLEESSAAQALRAWMDHFIDYMAAKHGMSDALPAILAAEDGLRARSREMLTDAVGTLMSAGVEQGVLRPEVDPRDVLMSLGGITLIAGDPGRRDLAGRLADLLMEGLRPRGASAAG